MVASVRNYQDYRLVCISASSPDELEQLKSQNVRAELKASPENDAAMNRLGYSFGDRTLGVSINLKRSTVDYDSLVRFNLRRAEERDWPDILRIAQASFPTDRRFHVRPMLDQKLANIIIQAWVEHLTGAYVCIYKDSVIGFIDLEPVSEKEVSIHLAAVEEQYRAAGAALSMYAYAIRQAREDGYQKVTGRISSTNTAVMNLYAYLGATFSEPLDVYLKEG